MYDVLDICRYVINYSNKKEYGISNLKLQKLLYFIQAYFLIEKDGKPCFRESIEAWDFGPVVRKAYHEFRSYGASNIPPISSYFRISKVNEKIEIETVKYSDDCIDIKDRLTINKIVDEFKDYSAPTLVELTHRQKPWKDAYKKGRNSEISTTSIRDYFS